MIIAHLLQEECLPLRNVTQQKVYCNTQLGHVLLEPGSRVLRSFPSRLEQVLVGLRVVQLDGLYASQVVIVPG